tara:strand:- start:2892 stop:3185 length:294 start_codon:yes stop_codon:yes gene_type:complete
MVDSVNEICLKRMLLKNIQDVKKKSGDFIRSQLVVPDSFNGTSRSVDIDYLIQEDLIYLKTVKPLFKCEFEELFNFTSGQFVTGKIISIPLKFVIIN